MKRLSAIFILVLLILPVWPGAVQATVYVDEIGRKVDIPERPVRIVSFAPSITEILFDLGLGDRVAGVTNFSDYPPEARKKPRVGSYIQINVEQVLALNPDLIIATYDGNKRETVDTLASLGVPVYVVYPENIPALLKTITDIGAITGVKELAEQKSRDFRTRLENVAAKAAAQKKVRVLMQIGNSPFVTVGKHTIQDELITLAGGINVSGDSDIRYPQLSMEAVFERRPQVIIITSMKREGEFDPEVNAWKQWTSLPAVRDSRIYVINSDLVDRASPRVFDGLERLYELIHGEG